MYYYDDNMNSCGHVSHMGQAGLAFRRATDYKKLSLELSDDWQSCFRKV